MRSFVLTLFLALNPLTWGGPTSQSIEFARGFSIVDHETYKLLTVTQPSGDEQHYALVEHGIQAPTLMDTKVVRIPAKRIALLSTTFLPHVTELDRLDTLVAISDGSLVFHPKVRERLTDDKIATVGQIMNLDIERLLAATPDLVLSYPFDAAHEVQHQTLKRLGIPVVLATDYLERHPLGRTEWMKCTASFLQMDDEAEARFDQVAKTYQRLTALAQTATHRPTVFANAPFKGAWYVPGGQSYTARLFQDAGANYLWAEDTHAGAIPVEFERVYEKAAEADYWLHPSDWRDLATGQRQDERVQTFKAFREKRVYNNNARVHMTGGNDFWEAGTFQAHRVLADLIKIFHPELLPNHKLHWYRHLQ